MIENYQNRILKLEDYGKLLYLKLSAENYKEITIKDLNIKYGISLTDSNRNKGNYPLLASNGISDYVDISNAFNAIVFGCRGTLGNVFYQSGKCFILNTAFYINNPCEYGNLYFALKHEKGLTLYSSGAAQPQITLDAIKDVKIKIPNSNKLNNVLDLISNYQKYIAILKEIKSKLLGKYF